MYKEKVESCGKRIAEALKIKGMKQYELCKLANVPKSSLSLYLSGAYEPKQDRVYDMAKKRRSNCDRTCKESPCLVKRGEVRSANTPQSRHHASGAFDLPFACAYDVDLCDECRGYHLCDCLHRGAER